MVCLGNICRSPLAQGILESKVDSAKVMVDSAGTAGYHIGNKPDHRSIAVGKKNGLDISKQRCRKFESGDFDQFDQIYAMDKDNFTNVMALARTDEDRNKVKLLLAEIDLGIQEVPDPYYGGDDGFDYIYSLIDKACDGIVAKLHLR